MPFKKLFGALGGDSLVNRLSGKTDVLEAVCAGAALVAYADGDASDAEISTAMTAIKANNTLNSAFSNSQIESTLDKILERAKGGRVGRAGLYKEIEEIAHRPEDAELVMYTVVDVADDDGIQDAEMAVIRSIATRLRLDHNRFIG